MNPTTGQCTPHWVEVLSDSGSSRHGDDAVAGSQTIFTSIRMLCDCSGFAAFYCLRLTFGINLAKIITSVNR